MNYVKATNYLTSLIEIWADVLLLEPDSKNKVFSKLLHLLYKKAGATDFVGTVPKKLHEVYNSSKYSVLFNNDNAIRRAIESDELLCDATESLRKSIIFFSEQFMLLSDIRKVDLEGFCIDIYEQEFERLLEDYDFFNDYNYDDDNSDMTEEDYCMAYFELMYGSRKEFVDEMLPYATYYWNLCNEIEDNSMDDEFYELYDSLFSASIDFEDFKKNFVFFIPYLDSHDAESGQLETYLYTDLGECALFMKLLSGEMKPATAHQKDFMSFVHLLQRRGLIFYSNDNELCVGVIPEYMIGDSELLHSILSLVLEMNALISAEERVYAKRTA